MKNHKLVRFLQKNPKTLIKLGVIVLGLVILPFQIGFSRDLGVKIAALKTEMNDINPHVAKAIASNALPRPLKKISRVIKSPDYELNGISVQGGEILVIINKSIHKLGDEIDGYIIKEINEDSVVMENENTSELYKLFLYNEPELIFLSKR